MHLSGGGGPPANQATPTGRLPPLPLDPGRRRGGRKEQRRGGGEGRRGAKPRKEEPSTWAIGGGGRGHRFGQGMIRAASLFARSLLSAAQLCPAAAVGRGDDGTRPEEHVLLILLPIRSVDHHHQSTGLGSSSHLLQPCHAPFSPLTPDLCLLRPAKSIRSSESFDRLWARVQARGQHRATCSSQTDGRRRPLLLRSEEGGRGGSVRGVLEARFAWPAPTRPHPPGEGSLRRPQR